MAVGRGAPVGRKPGKRVTGNTADCGSRMVSGRGLESRNHFHIQSLEGKCGPVSIKLRDESRVVFWPVSEPEVRQTRLGDESFGGG
jgi:hypothetical protein